MFAKGAACLSFVLFAIGIAPAQAAYMYDLSGEVTRGSEFATIPIDEGDSFTGTLTYTPENAKAAGAGCVSNVVSFSFQSGDSRIFDKGAETGGGCFQEGDGFIHFESIASNVTPEGYEPMDFLLDVDTASELPSASEMLAGLDGSDWHFQYWNHADNMGGPSYGGKVTSVARVPEPASLGLVAFGLACTVLVTYAARGRQADSW